MNLGRYTLGESVSLAIQTTNSSETPTLPTDAPVAAVYNSSGTVVQSISLPVREQSVATALFLYDLRLNNLYSAGRYDILVSYTVSSVKKCRQLEFEVLGGGDANGSGISMEFFSVLPRNYLLIQADGGRVLRKTNPRV